MTSDKSVPQTTERRDLCHRLKALGQHIAKMDSGSGDAALVLTAAAEIMRLRGALRVNGLRAGATHAEIDAVIYPGEPANA